MNIADKHSTQPEGINFNDSLELKLQKKLASLILHVKYEQDMKQECVDTILSKIQQYFNYAFDESLKEAVTLIVFIF